MVDIFTKINTAGTSRKTVTRKYVQKKTGRTVTKQYVYSKSNLLFRKTKTGYKIINKAWNEFEESIRKNANSESEAQSLINESRAIRKQIEKGEMIYTSTTQKGRNRIDVASLTSRLARSKAEKYIINMGLTPQQIINYVKDETGKDITEESLLNPGNWIQDRCMVKSTDGTTIELIIEFSYNGVSGIQINL